MKMETRQQRRARERKIKKIEQKINSPNYPGYLPDDEKKLYIDHLDIKAREYLRSIKFIKRYQDNTHDEEELNYDDVIQDLNIIDHDDDVIKTSAGYNYFFTPRSDNDTVTWGVIRDDIQKYQPSYYYYP